MIVNGIYFGPAWCAAGARSFDGRGYWFHRPLKPFGLDFSRSTLVTKTVTWPSWNGNMKLQRDGMTPTKLIPDCVYINSLRGIALNAIDLSNFGLNYYLHSGIWEDQLTPF